MGALTTKFNINALSVCLSAYPRIKTRELLTMLHAVLYWNFLKFVDALKCWLIFLKCKYKLLKWSPSPNHELCSYVIAPVCGMIFNNNTDIFNTFYEGKTT